GGWGARSPSRCCLTATSMRLPPIGTSVSPPAAAGPPPRPMRPLAVSQIGLAEHVTRYQVVTLPANTPHEHIIDPRMSARNGAAVAAASDSWRGSFCPLGEAASPEVAPPTVSGTAKSVACLLRPLHRAAGAIRDHGTCPW